MPDFQFVGVEQGVGLDVVLELEFQVLVSCDGGKHLRDFGTELSDVEVLVADLQLALFEAGVFQQVVEQVEDVVGRLLSMSST